MLHNLTNDLATHKPTLDLLRKRVLFEVPFVTCRNADIHTARLGSDDLHGVHALFREVDGARVCRVDLDGWDGTGDLDFE